MKFLKKKKLTVMIAAGLAGVSLSTVGFAGWVINAQTSAPGNVDVTFGDVSNRSYSATLDKGNSDLKLAFDSNGTVGTNDVTGSGENEHLTCKVVFKISNSSKSSGKDIFNEGMKSFKVEFSNYEVLSSLITTDNNLNLINSPVVFTQTYTVSLDPNNTSSNTSDATKKTAVNYKVTNQEVDGIVVTCTYTFGWGSIFDYDNPLQCKSKDNQLKGLQKLSDLTKGKTVQLGIKITPVFTPAA